MNPETVPDTELRMVKNHQISPMPLAASVLCEAAERWVHAYYHAPMHGDTARSANVALTEAVTGWVNAPFRTPSPIDRGAVRALLDGFASNLLQMDAKFRAGQYAEEATYHQQRSELTAEAVSRILREVVLANPVGSSV